MPTYQYRCTECSTELEAVQKFSDPPLTVCPQCQGELRKVFSAVGVVFKGSGFYATDSRSKGKANAAKPGESATKSDATKSDTPKSESKPRTDKAASTTASSAA